MDPALREASAATTSRVRRAGVAVASGSEPRATLQPVAAPPNAVVCASGLVPIPTLARVGLRFNALSVVLIPPVCVRWGLPEWARP